MDKGMDSNDESLVDHIFAQSSTVEDCNASTSKLADSIVDKLFTHEDKSRKIVHGNQGHFDVWE